MLKKTILLIFVVGSVFVASQVVNNVRLVDHTAYFRRVMQEVMSEVERREWCNLKLSDMTQNIDTTIYGWRLSGTVTYKNGFLVSLEQMDLEPATIQQIWTYSSSSQTSNVAVRGNLNLREVALGWDVEFAHSNGTVEHFTGVFTHQLIVIQFVINKVIERDEITISTVLNSLSGGQRRMIYLPETNVTQVLQRQYMASNSWDGVSSWRTQAFNPILLDVVTNKIPFPDVCYNCNI